jgi:lipid A oxidase
MRLTSVATIGLTLLSATALPAFAGDLDTWVPDLSVYGGYQGATNSKTSVSDGTHFKTEWEGKSFSMPPYWGVRGTWWLDGVGYDNLGIMLDYSHTKVYASDSTLKNRTPGWTHYEFTDGLNLATVNAVYKFPQAGQAWTPYLGAGLGVNVPHVEVIRPSKSGTGTEKTWNYQLGGITGQLMGGVDYKFTDHISGFTEIKLNYSHVDVDIDSGDKLKTNLFTGAVNLGLTYHF